MHSSGPIGEDSEVDLPCVDSSIGSTLFLRLDPRDYWDDHSRTVCDPRPITLHYHIENLPLLRKEYAMRH